MTSRQLLFSLVLAMGCTPRAGGGGGGFFDPDASAVDVAVTEDGAAVTSDGPAPLDVPAADDVATVNTDAVTKGDVPPTPCAGDESCGAGRFCDAGTCRAQVCTPGQATCSGANAITLCDPRGASRAEMPCPGGAACADGRCQSPRVCEPGAATCASTSARRVCTPDGTGYMNVNCASGEQCTDGACRATIVCMANSTFCNGDGQLRRCNDTGTAFTSMTCPPAPNAATTCMDGRCVANCTAGFANCDGDAANGCEVNLQSAAANCGACGNTCQAGQSCVAGVCAGGGGQTANFRVSSLLTSGCATVDHSVASGDDRGPLAALNGFLVVGGDTATVSINTSSLTTAAVPIRLDWITSNLRTGQLVVFSTNATPVPVETGGTATHFAIVDTSTGLPAGAPIALTQPITLRPGAGFFAGWDRAVVWDSATLWDINLITGQVRSLGPLILPQYAACELGGLWGIAETQGAETDLVYVSSAVTISRTRVSTRATTTVGTFSNLGDMCAISVHPGSGRWFFHHEGASQFRSAGDEVSGFCSATFTMSGPTCTAPEVDCGGVCANTQTSPAHCGRCNNACPSGQACNAGTCAATTGGYTRSTPTLTWTDACALPGMARVLTNVDDSVATATLPFSTFRYWGRAVTTATISSNGALNFDGTAFTTTGGTLPEASGSSNSIIAPWWVDLRTSSLGVCYATSGVAPNRSFLVQWNSATYYSGGAGPLTFQVRLNEGSNTIDFVYNSLVAAPGGYFPSVGIENFEGTQAVAVCPGYASMTTCATVTASTRIRFTPN
jgi:hypothetical protein